MNNNYQNNNKKYQRPLSSKNKSKNNPLFYLNIPKAEEQNDINAKNDNHSLSNINNISQNNDSQDSKKEKINDLYSTIQTIWNDLGITKTYQIQFHNSINNLKEEQVRNILIIENNNLKQFGQAVLKLSNEITSRENHIHSLQRNMVALSKNQSYLEDENAEKIERNREKLILEIIGLIKALRINSINVINSFNNLRELSTFYRLRGKIDMKLINSDYKYNDNYLQKMKTDMNFLKSSKIMKKYFDMNNGEIDAFLTNFDSQPSNNLNYINYNSNKAKVPVSKEFKDEIIKCRYILFQEDILDKMEKGGVEFLDNEKDNKYCENMNRNILKNVDMNNNRYNQPKIRFFKNNENNEQKDYPNIYDLNNNLNNKMNRIKTNNSSSKMMMNSKDKDFQERKKLEFLRLNMGKDYNNLFMNDKLYNMNKNQNKININNYTNENRNFRGPVLTGNKIKIYREERKKERLQLVLKNNFLHKSNPLINENQELHRQINDVVGDNEILKEEKNELKNKIKEIEKNHLEKEKIAKKKEEENQIFCKKLSNNIDELNLEKKDLNQKLKANQNLMEKYNKENNEKINNLNALNQQQKYQIDDLNSQKEALNKEKNDLINQREQLLNEKEALLQNKQNLEENLMQLNYQISENKLEIDNYKYTISENQQKIEEMGKKISELNNNLNNLNNEKIKSESDSALKISELSNKLNEMEKTIQNNQETISILENIKSNLTKEKEELLNSDNNAKIQINYLNEQINNLNIQINDKDEEIYNLKINLKDYNLIKQQNSQMQMQLVNQRNEIEKIKDLLQKIMPKYKSDFYRGNLFNFINSISKHLSLSKIPYFMKASFNLEEINIFEESTYIKGVYPKIIISSKENSDEITGLCSVYYENYGEVGDPLTLKIEALCVTEDNWEIQIKNMINFIKENIFFDEIKYIIKYIPNTKTGKLILDDRIKTFFKNELKCSWKNVINYANGSRTQEIRIVKEGDYFNKDVNITNNEQFFGLKSLSIVSIYEKNGIADIITENSETELKKKYSKIFSNKYINYYPIYLLLANNPKYQINFLKEEDKTEYELPKCKEDEEYLYPKTQIKEFTKMKFNLDNTSNIKEDINSLDTDNLLCNEVSDKLKDILNKFSINYLTMEINLSTPTNYCLKFENYIYNRISSKKIEVLRDPESKNLFYLIPTNNESNFIFISEIGPRLKEYLLDKNKNLYQALAELHPKLTNQLIQFSSLGLNLKDPKNMEKVIYIPSFKIKCHLFSFSVKDIKEKGALIDIETRNEENLGSIDECFKLSFEGDKNINDCFSIIPVEDKKLNMVIRESFLFGIFNINIIENSPLQLYYVTKDHWISA